MQLNLFLPQISSLTNFLPSSKLKMASTTSTRTPTSTSTSTSIVAVFLLLLLGAIIGCEARNINLGFVTTKDSHFLLNGSPFLFNGFNAYWMMHVASDADDRSKVTEVFRQASAAGLTVCRTWAFSDGGDRALQISPGTYDEHVFQGLDFVICEAKKYGIRLILSFVNNYKDFGGKAQYVEWAKIAAAAAGAGAGAGPQLQLQLNGADDDDDDEFYTNPVVKGYYKNHVRKVVSRLNTISRVAYKEDPTIMAWELMNEPRCSQAEGTTLALQGWVEEMASFVKSIDKKHLLEIGMEGFYGDSIPQRKQLNPGYQVGTDFITNNLVSHIDFATIHAYPDIWLSAKTEQEQMGFMERWMWNHWEDSKNILKKPLVIAEFGKKSTFNNNIDIVETDSYLRNIYRDIYRFASGGGGGGGTMSGSLIWQLMAQGMDQYHDGYQIILPQTPSTARIISTHSRAINALMSSHSQLHLHNPPYPHHHLHPHATTSTP